MTSPQPACRGGSAVLTDRSASPRCCPGPASPMLAGTAERHGSPAGHRASALDPATVRGSPAQLALCRFAAKVIPWPSGATVSVLLRPEGPGPKIRHARDVASRPPWRRRRKRPPPIAAARLRAQQRSRCGLGDTRGRIASGCRLVRLLQAAVRYLCGMQPRTRRIQNAGTPHAA